MQTFITYLVVALGLVALAQLVRVYELARDLKGRKEEDISIQDNKRMATMFLLFMLAFYAFYGWLLVEYADKLLPESASAHGEDIDNLMNFNLIIVNLVFFITNTILFVFAFKYYGNGKRKVAYFTHSNKLELIWTVIPSLVLAVIIIYGLKVWNSITEEAPEDSMVVELYSRQFDWTARYTGADNELGNANVRFIDGANFLGLDTKDSRGNDDIIVKNEFHLLKNKPVKFVFRSQDVIHSAYMPHFRSQMNTVPGMTTTWKMTPTKSTKEMRELPEVILKMKNINTKRAKRGEEPIDFDFTLLCNKICGASHYNMQMKIVVDETEEEYNAWLREQKSFAETAGLSVEPEVELATIK